MNTARIVAVGGGSLGEFPAIDEYIVSLSGRERPRFLFLPTASGDGGRYINTARRIFKRLGCDTDALCLMRAVYSHAELAERIDAADIIYAGGGDTVRMLGKWRETGLFPLLKAAGERGAVLCGVSAGAMCWFSYGYSDCEFYDPSCEHPAFRTLEGLGFIPAVCCPHYGEVGRERFDTDAAAFSLSGLALGNGAALSAVDGEYRIVKGAPDAKAYLFTGDDGKTVRQELDGGFTL